MLEHHENVYTVASNSTAICSMRFYITDIAISVRCVYLSPLPNIYRFENTVCQFMKCI